MKFRSILPLLLVLLLAQSCSLKRKNPLDPLGNPEIVVPAEVQNVSCTPSASSAEHKYVEVRWTANSPINTDGYFVYRGLAYNSEYAVVDTVTTNICNHGSEPWHIVTPADYWYKVSAYKDIYDTNDNFVGRLEGRPSEARFVRVPA
jgi:hypothetical protein